MCFHLYWCRRFMVVKKISSNNNTSRKKKKKNKTRKIFLLDLRMTLHYDRKRQNKAFSLDISGNIVTHYLPILLAYFQKTKPFTLAEWRYLFRFRYSVPIVQSCEISHGLPSCLLIDTQQIHGKLCERMNCVWTNWQISRIDVHYDNGDSFQLVFGLLSAQEVNKKPV